MSTLTAPEFRQITLIPKHTGANTQYYDISDEDTAYLYDWMIKFLADITETATHKPDILTEYFKRQPKLFPKGRMGPNSFASMLGGIVSAKVHDPKHNLSEPVLEPIELIFDTIASFYSGLPNAPLPVKFRTSLWQ